MENLLEKVHCVSCELQSDKIVLQNAIELIQSTKNELLNNRNEDGWDLLQEKSINIPLQNNITLKNKRNIRSGKVSKKVDDYYVLTTMDKKPDNPQANDLLMIDVYYTVIDGYLYVFKFLYLYNKYLYKISQDTLARHSCTYYNILDFERVDNVHFTINFFTPYLLKNAYTILF